MSVFDLSPAAVPLFGAVGGLSAGLVIGAFGLGCRHGLDVDHLSAITDLTCTQVTPKRSMLLASLYAAGHALVVLTIGVVAIGFGAHLPEGVDEVVGRLVGLSLMVLAVVTLVSIVRRRGDFRPRSRWMYMLDGWHRLVGRGGGETVVIVHDHPHGHDHEHHHDRDHDEVETLITAGGLVAKGGDGHADAAEQALERQPAAHDHHHLHRHSVRMPADPLPTYTARGAFGLGALHGIGAETPSQVLVLVAAAGTDSVSAGLLTLVTFLVGLVFMNTLVAAGASFGFAGASRNRWLLVGVSSVVAVASFVVGALFLFGNAPA